MSEDSENEKTEDPTQKRLDDALNRGDVAKSQEVNTWFVIAGATLVLSSFSGSVGMNLQTPLRNMIANVHAIRVSGPDLMSLMAGIQKFVVVAIGMPFVLLMLAAIAGNIVQHRFVWSSEQLKPSFSKISPMAGFKRVFGKQAFANFIKGLIKLAVLGAVMTAVMWPERHRLDAFIRVEPSAIIGITIGLALQLMGAVVAMLALVAIADYLFQYRQWHEKQKMSLQEIKDEFKQSEGDPHIKGKLRQMRQQRAKKRMMAAVPSASVIITNPTHFSVALKYEKGMPAPICVAKGVDAVAFRIRNVARDHDIPVVENVPLARALYATVDVDDEIPVEHYHAVAEVIGYVMKLKSGVRGMAR